MGLSLSGLGSGFDWQTTIEQLRQAEVQQRINPLEAQKARYQSRLTSWQSLGSKLSDFLAAVQDLKDTSDFNVFTPFLSTNSTTADAGSFLSVAAGSTAGKGTYNIKIERLAVSEKLQSLTHFTSTDQVPGWNSFYIEGQQVVLDGNETVSGIRDKINALNSGENPTGVTASVLKVADGDYRLILTKDNPGSEIDFTDPSSGKSTNPGFDESHPLQEYQTAKFSIDGIVYNGVTTNTIDDAIPGVTINLLKPTGALKDSTYVTVTIDRDQEAVQAKVQKFVDTYNAVIDFISQQLTYNEGSKSTGGALYGNAMVRSIKSTLQSTVVNAGLSDYGITFDKYGKISLDSDKLATAVQTDFSNTVSAFNSLGMSLDSILNNLTDSIDGTVIMQQESAQGSIDRIDDKIERVQVSIDHRMEILTNRFIAMDSALGLMQSQSQWLMNQLGALG